MLNQLKLSDPRVTRRQEAVYSRFIEYGGGSELDPEAALSVGFGCVARGGAAGVPHWKEERTQVVSRIHKKGTISKIHRG